jgi:hypothetical protein
MAKRIREQIDYGDRPERMDPRLERKLGDPESLYAKNPAMRRGEKDVQRLVSARFNQVADKLKQVTGNENIGSQQVQRMLTAEMYNKVPGIVRIESQHREELEQLAIEAALDHTEVSPDWFKIVASLNRSQIDVSNFRYTPEEDDEYEEREEGEADNDFGEFYIDDLSEEEEFELEKHKRNIINAIVQGAAKKGHYLFQKPEIKARLDAINPNLYRDYLFIMAINDFLYFTMEDMIEQMSQTGSGVVGKVQTMDNDDEDDYDEDEEDDFEDMEQPQNQRQPNVGREEQNKPDTKIVAQGMLFPILCHELVKGIEMAIARHGLPENPERAEKVMGKVDLLSNEPMQLRIGPQIFEKIRFALPDDMFESENKGLIPWFHTVLYQIPAKEFLEIIGNAISSDDSKVKKATSRFEEIMREAMDLKSQFEEYKEEKGSDDDSDNSSDDDDDDLDEFLRGLGIESPD